MAQTAAVKPERATRRTEVGVVTSDKMNKTRRVEIPQSPGLVAVVEEACKIKKIPLRGATIAIQGFGNAGSTAARLFAEKKAKIIALSDTRGGVTNSRGIDPIKAIRYKERSGTVVGMPGATRISNDDLLTMKCDILVPAALERQITEINAGRIQCRGGCG